MLLHSSNFSFYKLRKVICYFKKCILCSKPSNFSLWFVNLEKTFDNALETIASSMKGSICLQKTKYEGHVITSGYLTHYVNNLISLKNLIMWVVII